MICIMNKLFDRLSEVLLAAIIVVIAYYFRLLMKA